MEETAVRNVQGSSAERGVIEHPVQVISGCRDLRCLTDEGGGRRSRLGLTLKH